MFGYCFLFPGYYHLKFHSRQGNIGTMEAELKLYLSQRTKEKITDPSRVSAAVLVPLYQENGKYHVVFIRRSIHVPTHQGQIAFPGGARHVNDKSMLETALRESEEEIGLHAHDVEVLGELDDQITTTSNFIVTPFVGVMPWPYEFTLCKAEVERLFIVPLHSLLDPDRLKLEKEMLHDKEVPSFAYYYKGKRIWGATARILNKLLGFIKLTDIEK
jgi:8-oxo-dGTP pyrophosphatase MutT (NUDIX family)